MESLVFQMNEMYGELLKMSLPDDFPYPIALAVFVVESNGKPFGPDNKPLIRHEIHVFHRLWGKLHEKDFNDYLMFNRSDVVKDHKYRNNVAGPFVDLHTGDQAREWECLDIIATKFGQAAAEQAFRSTSFGMGQLMGFHYAALGYTSAGEMMLASHTLSVQIANFVQFLLMNPKLKTAALAKDWYTFGKIYNGNGNAYGARLKSAYEAVSKFVK